MSPKTSQVERDQYEATQRAGIQARRNVVRRVLEAGPKEWAELVSGPESLTSGPLPATPEGLAVGIMNNWRHLNTETSLAEARRWSYEHRRKYSRNELLQELRQIEGSSLF